MSIAGAVILLGWVTASCCAALLVRLDMFPDSQRGGGWKVQITIGAIFLGEQFIFSKTNSSQMIH